MAMYPVCTWGYCKIQEAKKPGAVSGCPLSHAPIQSGKIMHPTKVAPQCGFTIWTASVTIGESAEISTIRRKDPLSDWKLDSDNGNQTHCYKCFVELPADIDSAPLSTVVKPTYLKNVATGKGKSSNCKHCILSCHKTGGAEHVRRKFESTSECC